MVGWEPVPCALFLLQPFVFVSSLLSRVTWYLCLPSTLTDFPHFFLAQQKLAPCSKTQLRNQEVFSTDSIELDSWVSGFLCFFFFVCLFAFCFVLFLPNCWGNFNWSFNIPTNRSINKSNYPSIHLSIPLSFCLSRVSVAVMKRHDRKEVGEERVYLAYNPILLLITEGS